MTARTVLVALAVTLGALAALAERPGARPPLSALAREVEREEDHVTARELAIWIRQRRPGLRIIDLRPAEEFDGYHLPLAERRALSELPGLQVAPSETVVLYSEGGTHAAQGWFLLRARGVRRVYFLREGLYEWLTTVMNPTLPPNPTAEQRAAFDSAAALGRYFGGVPRTGTGEEPDAALPSADAAVRRVRRRGC